jgi:iron complex outermembrane receptor protein
MDANDRYARATDEAAQMVDAAGNTNKINTKKGGGDGLLRHTVLLLSQINPQGAGITVMRIATIVAVALFTTGGLTAAERAHASITHYELNIPSQPLDTALKDLAQQTGLQVGRFSDAVKGDTVVGPVTGNYSADQALKTLLAPTRLTYRTLNDRAIIVLRPEDVSQLPAAKTLSGNSPLQVTEEGPGERDSGKAGENNSFSSNSQQKSATSSQGSSDSSNNELEEVLVTATRRSESNDKVPISIVALSGAALDKSGVKGISDLAALIPGIEFDNQTGLGAGSVTNIAIRGVEPTAGASTTGIYIDDAAIQGRLTNASAFGNPYPLIFDLDRVEVLRGPQGTLFGAGAEGGALRFIQQEPSFTNYSAKAVAELGTTKDGNQSYEAGVAGGGPLADNLALRASAWHRTDGGYVDHVDPFTLATTEVNSNVTRSNAARLALAYRPIELLTVSPSIYWQGVDVNDTGAFYEYLSSKDHLKNGRLLQQPADDSFYLASLKIDANLSFADLISVTSYFHRYGHTVNDVTNFLGLIGGAGFFPLGNLGYGDPRGAAYPTSYADAAPQYSLIRQQITSEEIRLTSSDPNARLTWVAGLYFSHAHQEDPNTIIDYYIPNPPATSQPVFYQDPIEIDKQVAVFGQLDYTILPGLKASAGVRIARASVHAEEISSGIFAGLGPCCSTQESTEHPITPRVSLSYQADDRNLYYVSAAKGYRLGGGNVPPSSVCKESAPLSYASDSVWSYEVGAKNRLLDDRVQLETSVSHIDWSNLQQNILLADCGASYVTNAGKAVSNGFGFFRPSSADVATPRGAVS